MPPWVDWEEMQSVGIHAMCTVAPRYRPQPKVPFIGACARRIRGAVIDEFRKVDPVPRQGRQVLELVKEKVVELEQQYRREVSVAEAVRALRLDRRQRRLLAVALEREQVSLQLPLLDGESELAEVIPDSNAPSPREVSERADQLRRLRVLLDRFDRSTRAIVYLYYWEDRTLREIGKVLNLTESRISQRLNEVRARLRSQLKCA